MDKLINGQQQTGEHNSHTSDRTEAETGTKLKQRYMSKQTKAHEE